MENTPILKSQSLLGISHYRVCLWEQGVLTFTVHIWYSFYTCEIRRNVTDPGQKAEMERDGVFFCGALVMRPVHSASLHSLGAGRLRINAVTEQKASGSGGRLPLLFQAGGMQKIQGLTGGSK